MDSMSEGWALSGGGGFSLHQPLCPPVNAVGTQQRVARPDARRKGEPHQTLGGQLPGWKGGESAIRQTQFDRPDKHRTDNGWPQLHTCRPADDRGAILLDGSFVIIHNRFHVVSTTSGKKLHR